MIRELIRRGLGIASILLRRFTPTIRKPIPRSWSIGLGIAPFLLILIAYTTLSEIRHAENPDDRMVPRWSKIWDGVVRASTPDDTASALWRGDGEPPLEIWIIDDTAATFGRLFAGLGIGVAASIVLGMLMGSFAVAEAFFLPPFKFLAKIPPTAMLAIFFILIPGLGIKMYAAMIMFGVLPTLAQSVYLSAKKDVPEELVFKSYTLGASPVEVIWNVIFRQVLPEIIDAVRLQIGPAMVYLIAAEMLVADVGMGYRFRMMLRTQELSVVYYYIVVLGLLGYTLDFALRLFLRKVCPWYHKTT